MASKSYRKFMATGLSAAVVASVVAPVASAAYDDVKPGAWYEEAINYVTEMGHMEGTGKGFEPGSDMTRAQAAQLFANILGLDGTGLEVDFTDVIEGAWYYEAIAAVKEHGVMNGSGAKFNPGATLTRGEMAAIIVRAYELGDHEGREHSFTDIEGNQFATEIAILADLGIVDGVSEGKFAPDAKVNRAQMASFIFKTEVDPFPAVTSVVAVDTKTVEVTVEGALTQEQVDALVEAGNELTVEGEESHTVGKVTVKAAEASASEDTTTLVLSEIAPELVAGEELSLAVNGKEVPGSEFKYEAPATPEVTSVSAIGSKKFEVKFNKAVDTEKAEITVKKGSVSTNVEKVTFSEDKMTALVETTTKLTKGDYTVSVAGLSDAALSKTVTVADEKVSKIEVTTTTAPMNNSSVVVAPTTYNAGQSALVNYKVVNQYGEKMTNQSITWTQSTGGHVVDDAVNGKLTITNTTTPTNFIPGSKVFLTGVHAQSGTVVNAEVVIGLESKADQVVFKGVYNTATKKIEALPAGFDNNKYVLLFEVNDQYGNKLSLANHNDLVFTSNNPLFVSSTLASATDVEIDGVTYEAISLAQGTASVKGGEATIQAISKITGKTASYTVNADALAAVKTFTMSAPEKMVAEGEKVEIPFSAVDQYGKAVTKFDNLNSNITLSANAGTLAFEKQNDGTAKLFFTAAANSGATSTTDAPIYLTSLVRDGGSFSSLMVNVKDLAVPAAVIGLDSTKSTSIAAGNKVEILGKDLIVQDQYGRTLIDAKVEAWLANGNNSIIVTSEYASSSDTSALTAKLDNGSLGSDAETNVINTTTDKLVIEAKTAADLKATERLVFALSSDATTAIAASSKSVTFTKVTQSEYVSYEVAALTTMYHDTNDTSSVSADHAKTVKVYGVKADGTKVLLPVGDYSVSLDTNKLAYNSSTSKISEVGNGFAAAEFLNASGDYQDVEVQVLVTINDSNGAAAAIIEKDLLVSNKAPKVDSITLDADKVTDGKANITAGAISTAILNSYFEEVLDQYGVDRTESPVITITNLTKVTGSLLSVSGNGTTGTSISGATMGDKFTATYKYASGKSVSVDYTVGLDNAAPSISNVSITGDTVTVTFTESIADSTVATGDFVVGGTGLHGATVASVDTGATANDNVVEITLSAAPTVASNETITVALSAAGVIADTNATASTSTAVVTYTQQ
jgi:trimeric autotransporter adhesin